MRLARFPALPLLAALALGVAARAADAVPARLERTVYAMGTSLRIDAEGPSEEGLRQATESAFRRPSSEGPSASMRSDVPIA